MNAWRLCALEEIRDGGSAGFTVTVNEQPVELMAIRRRLAVFVYVNSCPHWGSPLDLCPGRFLNRERTRIHCSTHGAQFRIEDGFCIKGPCLGASLEPVSCTVRDSEVLITATLRSVAVAVGRICGMRPRHRGVVIADRALLLDTENVAICGRKPSRTRPPPLEMAVVLGHAHATGSPLLCRHCAQAGVVAGACRTSVPRGRAMLALVPVSLMDTSWVKRGMVVVPALARLRRCPEEASPLTNGEAVA